MINLSLEVKNIMVINKDEKIKVGEYLGRHKDIFEILHCMENSTLSLTYYWSGDSDQMLRIFITLATNKDQEAQQFMTYFKRHFPHIALDFSINKEKELTQAIESFPKIAQMKSKSSGIKFTKSSSKLQQLDHMADKLSHWNESWLLNISFETLSIDTKKLKAEHDVESLFEDLAVSGNSRFKVQCDNKLLKKLKLQNSKVLHYKIEFRTTTDINKPSLKILRQGMGASFWHDYTQYNASDYDVLSNSFSKSLHNSDGTGYLKQIKSNCIFTEDAPHLFQLPLSWDNRLFPVNNIPQFPMPANVSSQGIQLGLIEGAIKNKPFFLEPESLLQHFYLVGKTGMGKSTVLGSIANSLIEQNQQSVFLLDPHGDLAQAVLASVNQEDADRIVYIDFGQRDYCPGINVLEADDQESLNYAISQLESFLLSLYGPEIFGPRIQDAYRCLSQLLANGEEGTATLVDLIWAVNLDNKLIRQRFEKQKNVQKNINLKIFLDQIIKKSRGDGSIEELTAYFRAKFSPFIDNPILRNILGQQKSTLDFKQLAKDKKIVLFNLNKGRIGSRQAEFLGNIITTKIFQVALNNAKFNPEDRIPMTLISDEFQNYMQGLDEILSEARKFKLSLILANQFLTQIQENSRQIGRQKPLLDAILGNVATTAVFQLSNKDAQIMSAELGKKKVKPEQLASLRQFYAICRDKHQQLFTLKTIAPEKTASKLQTKRIIKRSIEGYCRLRVEVEREINKRLENKLGMVSTCEDSLSAFR